MARHVLSTTNAMTSKDENCARSVPRSDSSLLASRVDWVDYAKGICILLVVMMHSTLGVEKAAGSGGWLGLVVEFSRPFRMPDFFLISGLFLGLVIDRSWLRYLDRKVVHFIYFYVLWLTIQFAFKTPGWMANGLDGSSPGLGLADLFAVYLHSFIEPFGTLWFIYMLPVFFVITRLGKSIPVVMLGIAAILEILPINTGWLMVDEFAARYVYFLAGYLFASKIFAFADWVRVYPTKAATALLFWAVFNAVLVFAPVNPLISSTLPTGFDLYTYSHLPFVSLILGMIGALAIICGSVLLSRLHWAGFLEYLGRNSIVVYLAFFLPMAVSRALLLKFAPFLDIGTVSLLVTLSATLGAVIFYLLIQWSGIGHSLFKRPKWAIVEGKQNPAKSGVQAAE